MGLKENVGNTQFGGVDKTVDVPDVNLSGLDGGDGDEVTGAGTRKTPSVSSTIQERGLPKEKQVTEKIQEVSQDQNPSDQWRNIYSYIQNSKGMSTPLGYDEFVQKYSTDDNRRNNLFSVISSDAQKSGAQNPFQSANMQDFKDNEAKVLQTSGISYTDALGAKLAPKKEENILEEQQDALGVSTPIDSVSRIQPFDMVRDRKSNV